MVAKETKMYAIEFQTQVINGVIEVPEAYRQHLAGAVRVIILSERPAETKGNNLYPLRGTSLQYDHPTEPVSQDDWTATQ
jgi:hypothetical protein